MYQNPAPYKVKTFLPENHFIYIYASTTYYVPITRLVLASV